MYKSTGSNSAKVAHIEKLRRQVARAAKLPARVEETAPLGIADIDACLHGGLMRGALHEVAAGDHRSVPAALGFLLALTHVQHARGALLWPFAKNANPFGAPYPPGLRFFGIDPARILFVRCATDRDRLWTMEEGLRLGGVAAVIGTRAKAMDLTASRRLQLAAEQAATPVFLLRNYNDNAPSAAVTRWRIRPAPSPRDSFGFFAHARWQVALDYSRGGKVGEWEVEWIHDAVSLRLSRRLGDRAAGEDRAA